MRLFLTSAGLTTDTLKKSFCNLFQISPSDARVAFIPTAALVYGDDPWWRGDVQAIQQAGVGHVEIVDISSNSIVDWMPSLEASHGICFGGGNSYYLMDWMRKSGLERALGSLLETRVYMGISAGSQIAGPSLQSNTPLFPEEDDNKIDDLTSLKLVPFEVVPHLFAPQYSKMFPEEIEKFAKTVSYPIYALDDSSAVQVVDGKVLVVSTGKWCVFNT